MRVSLEKGGVGSLNYIDTTPIPLDHEIHSSTIHVNSRTRHHLNSDPSTTNLKYSVCRCPSEIHVFDHIPHKEIRTITINDMCCWPFVDVILEESPPKRKSATRAKRGRLVPTAAVGKQDKHVLVSDRIHMHPGVSEFFFDTNFLPLTPTHFPFPRYNTNFPFHSSSQTHTTHNQFILRSQITQPPTPKRKIKNERSKISP